MYPYHKHLYDIITLGPLIENPYFFSPNPKGDRKDFVLCKSFLEDFCTVCLIHFLQWCKAHLTCPKSQVWWESQVAYNLCQISKARGSDKLWPSIQSLIKYLNLLDEQDKLKIIQTKGSMRTQEKKEVSACLIPSKRVRCFIVKKTHLHIDQNCTEAYFPPEC